MTELIAWVVVLGAITYMYRPLVIRLYGWWKAKRKIKLSTPSTLLGAVYPKKKDKDK